MGKIRLPSVYYIQFDSPISEETVNLIFETDENDIDIAPTLSGSFLLATYLSFSKLKFILECYEEENSPPYKERILLKLKADSEPDHRRFG